MEKRGQERRKGQKSLSMSFVQQLMRQTAVPNYKYGKKGGGRRNGQKTLNMWFVQQLMRQTTVPNNKYLEKEEGKKKWRENIKHVVCSTINASNCST